MYRSTAALFISLLLAGHLTQAAEVVEAGPGLEDQLPGGKEADGIRGDFVLRNNLVEAVISHNAPLRRANMSTFYGDDGISPGCLYDLTLRGANNDQLVIYAPCGHGPVSYVREVATKEPDTAAIETVITAASNGGVFERHEYRVREGHRGIFITTIFRNESDQPAKVSTRDDWNRFNVKGSAAGIDWVDSINPAHKCGYALGILKLEGVEKLPSELELAPGQEVVVQRFFAVGTSPADAVCAVLTAQGKKLVPVAGRLIDQPTGKGISTGVVQVPFGKSTVPCHPDAEGRFVLMLPPGPLKMTASDLGRDDAIIEAELGESGQYTLPDTAMSAAARIRIAVTDEAGVSTPCKAQFHGVDGTPNPNLGAIERAHGCKDQYHSEDGAFTVQLPPGKYKVIVTHGPEYSHIDQDVTVDPDKEVVVSGKLQRLVDTTGWISSDFHNHSSPSGDNVCDTDGRVINLAAEHIEFAPTTEHNRFYDWEPTINALGLTPFIKTVKGVESTGRGQHFNAFPFEPDPALQDGGAPVWNDDPRITALTLRRWQGERPERWIQFNHPTLSQMFADRNADGIVDGGFVGVGDMIDGMESQNGNTTNILADAPFSVSRTSGSLAAKVGVIREFVWRQLLNQGHRLTAVAVADAHTVYGNGVGGWRIYLPSSTDDPAKINWADLSPHAKSGHIFLTTGPFLEVTTPDGKIAGDDVRSGGGTTLHVRVQCTDWQDIDRVQVLVNSRPDPRYNFTRTSHPDMFQDGVVKFDQKIKIPLQSDAHLIVVAMHETMTLKTGFGTSPQSNLRPCAYNNPIYVDVNGNGFQPNHNTLGFDLPSMKLTADEAKAQLIRAGLMEQPAPAPDKVEIKPAEAVPTK